MTTLLTLICSLVAVQAEATDTPADSPVIAVVNGQRLTARDLDAYFSIRGVRGDVSPSVREAAKGELIDRELVRQFLARRKTVADPESLAAAMRVAKRKLAAGAEDLDAALEKIRLDESRVKDEVSLALAWNLNAKRTIADSQIRRYWEQHTQRLDGTRLRVSQIFRKYEPGESVDGAAGTTAGLQAIRKNIADGKTTFAEAAKASSQAPTASQGGDLGIISPRGDLPAAVTDAAYALKAGDISEVILSPFGAHLIVVTEVKPGDLSLEDARPMIFSELSDQLWNDTVAGERKTATIVEPRGSGEP